MDIKIKVFIVTADLNFDIKLTRYLQIKDFKVRSLSHCRNTDKLLSKIDEYKPDVLIFDAKLFSCDIVWLISKIKNLRSQVYPIVLMPRRDWRIDELVKVGSVSCLYMPYDLYALYEEIITKNNIIKQNSISEKIRLFVKNSGVNEKLNGFQYTCSAIYIILFENNKYVSLTKDIYPEIAVRHGSNYNNVERCIRNCIKVFMKDSGNREYLYYLESRYGNISTNGSSENLKVTNSKFLKLLATVFKNYYM
ncbi:MAG: sporulation initiation factor Spo0A C-terminal domain-containing protein [Oscillospiraceae bacterium]|nr:sporulation initiation factor Spo0A C-terminal domain-containing protein [Oscillospiraceae bacterium]